MSKKTNVPVSIRNRMEKIYTYIKYCQRLEDAYRTKHEEVRTLNDYLIRIQKILPHNVSTNCPEVEDIITYIEGLPNIPETSGLIDELDKKIDEQKKWKEENERNYNLINRKINKLNETQDITTQEHSYSKGSLHKRGHSPKRGHTNTRINEININGTKVIPFYKEHDLLNDKYGGGFLSSYAHLKNPIILKYDDMGKLKFCCVCAAYYSNLSRFMKDKTIYKNYLTELSQGNLSYEDIRTIKNKYMGVIKKNPNYKKEWAVQKYPIMRSTHILKYNLNPEMKKKLKEVGESYLIQHSNDKYWGNKENGKNLLGKLLMEIRTELFGGVNKYGTLKIKELRKVIEKNIKLDTGHIKRIRTIKRKY